MKISSADFCKLSLQEVADLLLENLEENKKECSGAKLYGRHEGHIFELGLVMRKVKE